MLLVADDANAAYSNPRPLPKCAQTLLPFIPQDYRTGRRPDATVLATSKNTSGHVGTPVVATLDDMGYRGEDVPTTRGDWGRQTPWQPSSGAAPGSTGARDGESRGYTDDETYPPADGGYGYGPDGGYPGQGQQGYAPQESQGGDAYGEPFEHQQPYEQQPYEQQPYEQQPYEQYSGYGPGQGQ